MATLNQNPLINNSADRLSDIVLAHKKDVISAFNLHGSKWKLDSDTLFDDTDWDESDTVMQVDNDDVDQKQQEREQKGTDRDAFTASEIFDMIRSINDPEHPLTLEQLAVVKLEDIVMSHTNKNKVVVRYTPTIPHCSMATLIGLSIRVKLLRSLPTRFKVRIQISPNTHQSEKEINKQLNDKERVAAALENDALIKTVNQCIKTSVVST